MAVSKRGLVLKTLSEWETHAGPKSSKQWVDGRSAKETARAWLACGAGELPAEISSLLEAHSAFGPVRRWEAEPEVRLRFDAYRGEPRNTDMLVRAEDAHGSYLIAVESKADEPFGSTVGDTLADALERKLANSASKGIARVEELTRALFGVRREREPAIKLVRYQLLTACAGLLAEAERTRARRAILLVHEFHTSRTDDRKHEQNAKDLDRFVERLSHGSVREVKSAELHGPLPVPGSPRFSSRIDLYVGKVSRDLRERSSDR